MERQTEPAQGISMRQMPEFCNAGFFQIPVHGQHNVDLSFAFRYHAARGRACHLTKDLITRSIHCVMKRKRCSTSAQIFESPSLATRGRVATQRRSNPHAQTPVRYMPRAPARRILQTWCQNVSRWPSGSSPLVSRLCSSSRQKTPQLETIPP